MFYIIIIKPFSTFQFNHFYLTMLFLTFISDILMSIIIYDDKNRKIPENHKNNLATSSVFIMLFVILCNSLLMIL